MRRFSETGRSSGLTLNSNSGLRSKSSSCLEMSGFGRRTEELYDVESMFIPFIADVKSRDSISCTAAMYKYKHYVSVTHSSQTQKIYDFIHIILQAGNWPLHHDGINVKNVNLLLLSSPVLLWLCVDSAVPEAGLVGPEAKTRIQTGAAYCRHGS